MGFSLNLKPVRQCPRGKRRFHSEHEARMGIISMEWRHGNFKDPAGLRPYWCGVCDAFHIGHPKESE